MKWQTPKTYGEDVKEQNVQNASFVLFGKVPNKYSSKRLKKINRFLWYQQQRVERYKREENWGKIFLVWSILLKSSKSYHLSLFHRNKPDWYWKLDGKKVRYELERFSNQMRSWKFGAELERFYVLKSKDPERQGLKYEEGMELCEGEKLRPIGSPRIPTGCISKAITDLITFIFDEIRNPSQHAYRPNRGIHTAIRELIGKIRGGGTIIEFDLKSFFNKVPQAWIWHQFYEGNQPLGRLIMSFLWHTNYSFETLKPETELKYMGMVKMRGYAAEKPYIVRSGLPQGLSLSPVLSCMSLEWAGMHPGVVMYADDGVFVGDEREFYRWTHELGQWGLELSGKKTSICEGKFNFLGCEIDPEREKVKIGEMEISFDDKDLEKKLLKYNSKYKKVAKEYWEWDINSKSYLKKKPWDINLNWYEVACTWISSWKSKPYKDLIWIKGRIYSITKSSSYCLDELAKDMELFSYKKIKGFSFDDFEINLQPEEIVQNRRNHFEIWLNREDMYTRNLWDDLYWRNVVKKGSQKKTQNQLNEERDTLLWDKIRTLMMS